MSNNSGDEEESTNNKVETNHHHVRQGGERSSFMMHSVAFRASTAPTIVADELNAMGRDLEMIANRFASFMRAKSAHREEELAKFNLFQSCYIALSHSILMYGIADLRSLASKGVVPPIVLPVNHSAGIKYLDDNAEELKKGNVFSDIYIKGMKDLAAMNAEYAAMMSDMGVGDQEQHGGTLVVFDDEHSSKELVYGIVVDSVRKRILLGFRGSVTVRDWAVDADMWLMEVDNPLLVRGTQRKRRVGPFTIPQRRRIGIHHGFYDYLLGIPKKPRRERAHNEDDADSARRSRSKFEIIVEHLQRLIAENQGFAVHVTGHSLGGALAILFTFYAACTADERIPKPISCISFASPRVGNVNFSHAFNELELEGQIHSLRVVNHLDAITGIPDRLTCLSAVCQERIYRHVGVELRLYRELSRQCGRHKRTHIFRFPRVYRSRLRLLTNDFVLGLWRIGQKIVGCTVGCIRENYYAWHSCDEYVFRLRQAGDELSKTSAARLEAKFVRRIMAEDQVGGGGGNSSEIIFVPS